MTTVEFITFCANFLELQRSETVQPLAPAEAKIFVPHCELWAVVVPMRFFQRESRECTAIELLHKTRTFFYKQKNVVNAAFGLSKSQSEKTLHETRLFQKSRCSHASNFFTTNFTSSR